MASSGSGSGSSTIASTVSTDIKAQAKAALLVPVNTALTSIISTPSTQNVVGQGAQLLASLVPLLPVLEGDGIKDIAVAIQTALNKSSATPAQPVASAS